MSLVLYTQGRGPSPGQWLYREEEEEEEEARHCFLTGVTTRVNTRGVTEGNLITVLTKRLLCGWKIG